MRRKSHSIIALVCVAVVLITSSGCGSKPTISNAEISSDKPTVTATVASPSSTETALSEASVASSESSGEVSSSASVPETSVVETPSVSENNPPPESKPNIAETIRSGIVYDLTEQQVLFSKNPDERVYPASLVKLVTACTALKYVSKDTVFTVGSEQELVRQHSSLCLILKGHRLTLEDLICGMLMSSGNDAAYTIAVYVARTLSEEDMTDEQAVLYFCGLMNDFAAQQGMSNSHFTNPDGWDDSNQYSTASDLLKIAVCAQNNAIIKEIIGCDKSVLFLLPVRT